MPAVPSMNSPSPAPNPTINEKAEKSTKVHTELQLVSPDRLTWLLKVNMLMSNKGTVLRADVNGRIVMKVFLSGMPDVKLGLNDKLEVRMRRHPKSRLVGGALRGNAHPGLQHCVCI